MSNWEWDINSEYIFGYNKNNEELMSKIKSIYLFDLDNTLIKTKSGKKFPIDKHDWEFLSPNVKIKLNDSLKIFAGIITNQKGLNNSKKISEWVEKCINICDKLLSIKFIFASITDNKYRKPLCGSNNIYISHFNNISWNKLKEKNKIYYIGDAFGRKDDFSDTDIKYAINSGYKYKTPEIFFDLQKNEYVATITYPEITFYNEIEENNLFSELENLIKNHKQVIIMMIGLPSSGKTFLRKELIKRYPKFVYLNNDENKITSKNKITSEKLIKKISNDYDYIIDDNTNLLFIERDNKLNLLKNHYKIAIWFDYDFEICWHLNWLRMYWFNEKLLSKITFYTLRKKFISENIDKNFNKLIKISKVFNEFDFNKEIKYYF
jgi:bifunctional polynucleotide phosphatase/kinase